MRIHHPVIMHHDQHQPAREGMAIDQRDGRHRVRQDPPPQGVQALGKEAGRKRGMLEIQAVAVELLDAGGCDDDAGGVAGFDDVEGEEEGLAEGLAVRISMRSRIT